jgi:zinc transporter 1/2/3
VASLFAIFLVDMLLMRHIHRSRKAMDELKARRAKDKAHLESLTLLSIRPIDSPAPVDVDMAMLHNASSLPTWQAVVPGKTPDGSSRADGAKPLDADMLNERLRRNEMIEQEEKLADAKLRQRAKELDVMIIEGGIVFHSVMVGLGLGTASDAGFVPYFIAIVFHQMFDGFGEYSAVAPARSAKRNPY